MFWELILVHFGATSGCGPFKLPEWYAMTPPKLFSAVMRDAHVCSAVHCTARL